MVFLVVFVVLVVFMVFVVASHKVSPATTCQGRVLMRAIYLSTTITYRSRILVRAIYLATTITCRYRILSDDPSTTSGGFMGGVSLQQPRTRFSRALGRHPSSILRSCCPPPIYCHTAHIGKQIIGRTKPTGSREKLPFWMDLPTIGMRLQCIKADHILLMITTHSTFIVQPRVRVQF